MKRFLSVMMVVILTLGFGATAFAGSRGDFWADLGEMVGALSNKHHEQSEKNAHIGRFAGRVLGSSTENRHGYYNNYYNDPYYYDRSRTIVVNQPPRHYNRPPVVIYEQAPVIVHQQNYRDYDRQYRDDYNYRDDNRGRQHYDEQNNGSAYSVPCNAVLQKVFRGKTAQVEIYDVQQKAFAEEMVRANGGKVYYGHDVMLILRAEAKHTSYQGGAYGGNYQKISVVARVICGPNRALQLIGTGTAGYYSNYGNQEDAQFEAFAKAFQNLH